MLAFVLTMPGVGSWNGKWTGADRFYAKVRKEDKKKEADLDGRDFFYRWDDGWTAKISVSKVDGRTAQKIRKNSDGFCGYDWMIDSIIQHGEIRLRDL